MTVLVFHEGDRVLHGVDDCVAALGFVRGAQPPGLAAGWRPLGVEGVAVPEQEAGSAAGGHEAN